MRLLTPGPATCLPQVLDALSLPLIHHRTQEFQTLYKKDVESLKHVFATSMGEVAILSGSGTTGLEASILNAFSRDDQVLVIECGYFGERLVNIAKVHHLHVIVKSYPWDQTFELEDMKQTMKELPDLKGVLMVYSETSTGALHDIQAMGKLVHDMFPTVLLMVDCISGLVMNPFYFDAWHIDIAVAASQKGFFLPPGLAFVCLSPKAMIEMRARQQEIASVYMNLLVLIDKYHDHQKIGTTPNISMLQGLGAALDVLACQSNEQWSSYYQSLQQSMASKLLALGLVPFTQTSQSNSLFVCRVEDNQAFAIRNALYDKTKVLIEVGLGKDTDSILRIGCMNAITIFDVLEVCSGLTTAMTQSSE